MPFPPTATFEASHASQETYGLVGFPLGHSFSAQYFAEKFSREGIPATYQNFEKPSVSDLRQWAAQCPNLRGFNVTIPHKQAVIPYLDGLSQEAKAIGAVNVVSVTQDADGALRLLGTNSDWIGFTESLRPLLHAEVQRALVLGTGGASRAVLFALLRLGIQPVGVSRKSQPAGIIVGDERVEVVTYEQLTPKMLQQHLLIVSTTPLGMHPHVEAAPEISYAQLTPRHVLYDLVYNPLETRFMQLGRAQGATVKNGLEMLHLQAEAAWNFWQSGHRD